MGRTQNALDTALTTCMQRYKSDPKSPTSSWVDRHKGLKFSNWNMHSMLKGHLTGIRMGYSSQRESRWLSGTEFTDKGLHVLNAQVQVLSMNRIYGVSVEKTSAVYIQ